MTGSPLRSLRNREAIEAYEACWHWPGDDAAGGLTAVLRVRDEARNLPFVLPPLLRAVDRVVLVDNGSHDRSADVARETAHSVGRADRLDVLEYPFEVARCGSEHARTPPDSVHSLTFFYNWSFSHVTTRYALKWDGDMLLTAKGERALADLAWQLEAVDAVIVIPRHPVFVRSEHEAFVDVTLENLEPWGWPNKPGHCFGKGLEWEIQIRPPGLPNVRLPEWLCFELKWLDADEFSHWSDDTDFEGSDRTGRKRREWETFQALRAGRTVSGLVPVRSTGDEHVVDRIRRSSPSDWTMRR